MNPQDQIRWKCLVLDLVFEALASCEGLRETLVFKGARVLNARLGGGRQSLDIDSNLTEGFLKIHPDRAHQRDVLERDIGRAVRRFFERQQPVRYELRSLVARPSPPQPHPLGWDAFKIRLTVVEAAHPDFRGVPALELDIAAPEELGPHALAPLRIGGNDVTAYTLERIAGEKLRAFLTSLPAYRRQFQRPGESVRVKDLHDLAQIHGVHRVDDASLFWRAAATEFQIACRSRLVDCAGAATFREAWEITAQTYRQDPTIPAHPDFDQVDRTLAQIVRFLEQNGFVPLAFEKPPNLISPSR